MRQVAHTRRGWGTPTLAAWVLLCASAAVAAPPGVGRPAAAFERGAVADQLALDVTPIPAGMGALFVPSATDPALEPEVVVRLGTERVAWARTGTRVILPPGAYEVLVGDGPLESRARAEVTVLAGVTSATPRFFGALRVTAVDLAGRPMAVPYRLVGTAGGAVGEGTTTAQADYRATRTWLMAPGALEVVFGGQGDERESVALWLPPGEVARYRLVFDRERLVRAEFAQTELVPKAQWWRARWVIGGDASVSRTSGRLGAFNGDFLRAGLMTSAEIGIDQGPHLATLSLDVSEAWIGLNGPASNDFASQKFDDEVRVEALYVFRPARVAGPYVRGEVATALFPTDFEATRALRHQTRRADGTLDIGQLDVGDSLALFDRFEPLALRGGAGVSVTPVDNRYVTLLARAGLGLRRARYGGGRFIDAVDGDLIRLVEVRDDTSWGAEARIEASARAGQSLSFKLFGDAYVPEAQLAGDDDLKPILRLTGQAAFAVNPFLSLVYEAGFRREAYEIEDLQFSDHLSLRVQHSLF